MCPDNLTDGNHLFSNSAASIVNCPLDWGFSRVVGSLTSNTRKTKILKDPRTEEQYENSGTNSLREFSPVEALQHDRVDSGRRQDRTLRGMAPVECGIDGWS